MTQKPLVTTIPDFSAILVKLGHLLESGRVQEKFEAALAAILDNDHNFEFIEYPNEASLPQEFFVWAAERDALLVLTVGACDLQEDEVQLVNMIDNGNWRSPHLQHHCVKGKCTLGCNGSRARARKTMKRALKITCGPKMAVAVLYRWKGFQQASSKMLRARRQHHM